MKQFALAAVTAVIFTGGMFAGLVEKEVAEVRGEAPIAEALALDNAETGVCAGMASAMCYPVNCIDDKCPSNNQCTGNKKCQVSSEAVGPGTTRFTCELYGACDSSEDAEFVRDYRQTAVGDDLVVSQPEETSGKQGPVRLYTSYY